MGRQTTWSGERKIINISRPCVEKRKGAPRPVSESLENSDTRVERFFHILGRAKIWSPRAVAKQETIYFNKFPVDKKHKIFYNLYDIMKIILKGTEKSGKTDNGFKRRPS